jgi:hypothetical protein
MKIGAKARRLISTPTCNARTIGPAPQSRHSTTTSTLFSGALARLPVEKLTLKDFSAREPV